MVKESLFYIPTIFFTIFNVETHSWSSKLLNDYTWSVTNSNRSININTAIPGGIFSDLRKNNILKESINYRYNDVEFRWVSRENWTYMVIFENCVNSYKSINEIIFHGLDGVAKIYLNGKQIGNADNTFIRYRYSVSNYIINGVNNLTISFESPIVSGLRWRNSHMLKDVFLLLPTLNMTKQVRRVPKCGHPIYNGECYINYLRKMPISYGWDNSFAAPSVGIWKDVELVSHGNELLVRDILVQTIHNCNGTNDWTLMVDTHCEGPIKTDEGVKGIVRVTVTVNEQFTFSQQQNVILKANSSSRVIIVSQTLSVPQNLVDPWFPSGYGSQKLYELAATFENKISETYKVIKIGFREIKVVENSIGSPAHKAHRTFYMSVNGVPVFAKGTTYIPHSVFIEEAANRSVISELLTSVHEANMNTVRVWGGGIYADDYFYEECDRLGILVWQDFVFIGSTYSVDSEFLSSVRTEVAQQVGRLQHHPSVAAWFGSDEIEVSMTSNRAFRSVKNRRYTTGFFALYVDTIRETVINLDTSRSFFISTPSDSYSNETSINISINVDSIGDMHYFEYQNDVLLTDQYPVSRFTSAYGFQSLPSYSSLQSVATAEDLSSIQSDFFRHRQHQPIGYVYLLYQILLHFGFPKLHDVKNIIYVSQIFQALAVKSQTEWYRSWRSSITFKGRGYTMGALYWQLNDVWQAPTWSSIGCKQGKKMHAWYDIRNRTHFFRRDEWKIDRATAYIHGLIDEEVKKGIPPEQIVLGGFSQGGAMALHAALTYPKRLAGIVAFCTWLPPGDTFCGKDISDANLDIPILKCSSRVDQTARYKIHAIKFKSYAVSEYPISIEEMDEIKQFMKKVTSTS